MNYWSDTECLKSIPKRSQAEQAASAVSTSSAVKDPSHRVLSTSTCHSRKCQCCGCLWPPTRVLSNWQKLNLWLTRSRVATKWGTTCSYKGLIEFVIARENSVKEKDLSAAKFSVLNSGVQCFPGILPCHTCVCSANSPFLKISVSTLCVSHVFHRTLQTVEFC